MVIETQEQIELLRNAVLKNAEISFSSIQKCISNMTPLRFFAAVKFEKLGRYPINGHAQNFIEQVNQMYSDLVVLHATENLLLLYPEKNFELQLGVSPGYDIQSTDGLIVAECFAVTTVSSNRKLAKDCQKLIKSSAPNKYIFFYSHQDNEEKLQRQFDKYPEIHFKKVPLDL